MLTAFNLKKAILREEMVDKFTVYALNADERKFFSIDDYDSVPLRLFGFQIVLQAKELPLPVLEELNARLINVAPLPNSRDTGGCVNEDNGQHELESR